MATRSTVTLIDDLDGGIADESVQFGLDGRDLEIDLSAANATALREVLSPYVAVARRVGGRPASPSPRSPVRGAAPMNPSDRNRLVRIWAREHGMSMSQRGRLPGQVVAAYEADDPSLAAPSSATPTRLRWPAGAGGQEGDPR